MIDPSPAAAALLAGGFARAREAVPEWSVHAGRVEGPGWAAYPAMLTRDRVAALLGEVEAALGGGPATAAQTLVGRVAGPVIGVLAAVVFRERRLAVVEPGGLWFRCRADRPAEVAVAAPRLLVLPGDPAAGAPGVTVVEAVEDLQLALVEQAHELFAPFVELVSAVSRRGRRALWQGLADRIGVGFLHAGKRIDAVDRARAEAESTLACRPDGPLRLRIDWLQVGHEWFKRKSVCCLHYKSELHRDRYCATCPLLPREESLERLGTLVAARAQNR